MKVKKLIISGFGPYAERQELDFEENLKDKNMFVICGNTGAGKTTIFDAINFALYGEANGSDREGKSLRSHFADSKTPTEVELWFSLRGKDYYVKRSPSYLRPKQRGEGFVESKPMAEIRISKDKTITGFKEVTREVENILGITTEQFKQLVMIPQGEFKKLLNAKSDEKEEIFRKIFGTEVFERIQREIREEAKALKNSIERVQRDRLNKIRSFICGEEDDELFRIINADNINIDTIMESFKKAIERDIHSQKVLEENIEKTTQNIKKFQKEINLGEAINSKFDKLENVKKELDKLEGKIEEYKSKKNQLDRAKKAITVRNFEEKYEEKNEELKNLKSRLEELEKNLELYTKSYEKAKQEFVKQQSREEEKNKIIKNIDEKLKLKEKVSEYEKTKKQVEFFNNKVKAVKERIENININILKNEERLKIIDKNLENINLAKDEKRKLEVKKVETFNKLNNLKELYNSISRWIKYKNKHDEEVKTFEELDKIFISVKNNYEKLEDIFRKSQAGILALNLEEGTPCPVCGSTHHPKLAKIEDNDIREEKVKKEKETLEVWREKRDKCLSRLTEINSSLKIVMENSIGPLSRELLNIEVCEEDLDKINNEVKNLYRQNKDALIDIENRIRELDIFINKEKDILEEKNSLYKNAEELRRELQLKNEELVVEEGKLSAANSTLTLIKNEFNGEIKTSKELEDMIISLNNKLSLIKKEYENAEKIFNASKSKLDNAKGIEKSTREMKERAESERNEALEMFKRRVLDLGFTDYLDYKHSVLSEEKIEALEEEINKFNSDLLSCRNLYETLLKDVEGLSRIDLSEINEKLKKENEVKANLDKEAKEIFARIKNNKTVLEDCNKHNKSIKEDEEKYKIVGRLSNIINGDNSKKISFERYVLASYFERIIDAANLRFNKMTSGRFELLRKEDMGDKRKGQGLDLEVLDNYTGKARDIGTLSGGESFKASLSMALGLADVVQANTGGIQLDTMFIDEGFGTLDPESLDNAIECLMELQNDGRLVGIISHVAELKERIQTRLEIRTTNKGSKAEFKV
ncbi:MULTISPECIES: AAA family ATPase [Clostridium]|uniref:Nuclease SbcCD subunit C n=1 Tax=Clostridium colicanis DSM 13634 TaxID=1121305 RepID=A0A151ALD4_9CLOT|nr:MULTISPECIES: AAA family ATPase [Clostridium]KYH28340.1 nuclease SbcCD subunit C [Clostridium colicanis DSM 13634]MBE6043604.1 SMC family ATPase [Clostridium thermopalmarium]